MLDQLREFRNSFMTTPFPENDYWAQVNMGDHFLNLVYATTYCQSAEVATNWRDWGNLRATVVMTTNEHGAIQFAIIYNVSLFSDNIQVSDDIILIGNDEWFEFRKLLQLF